MNILISFSYLLLILAISYAADVPIGFGKDATGGTGGVEYHVNSFQELVIALNNNDKPEDPKIIYIDSPINSLKQNDGSILDQKTISPDFDFERYINCFSSDGVNWNNSTICEQLENFRKEGSDKLHIRINVNITPNTSIIGNGKNSKLEEISLLIENTNNIIIKNLYIQSPTDIFPEWTHDNNASGKWSTDFDSISINNSTNIWIDNCYFTDGDNTQDKYEVVFNKPINSHDGLIDIINSSDKITISGSRFENHKYAILIGSSDRRTTDIGHLSVTLFNNVFINCSERLPRVRFGNVHVFNNYYYNEYPNEHSYEPNYYIGIGLQSNILSEYNSFNYKTNNKDVTLEVIKNIHGSNSFFHDNGSLYNGEKTNLDKEAIETCPTKDLSNEAFNPNDYYTYTLNTDFKFINQLPDTTPSWVNEKEKESSINNNNLEKNEANSLINMSKFNILIIFMTIFALINLI